MKARETVTRVQQPPAVAGEAPGVASESPGNQTEWASILVLELTVLCVLVPATALTLSSKVRVLEFVATLILSSLPGFLYVRFVEFRGPSVWNEYVFNLHRLGVEDDSESLPPTLDDLRQARRASDIPSHLAEVNIYTQKFDAHFGSSNRRRWEKGQQDHHLHERRPVVRQLDLLMPILVSTLVIGIGWAIVFAEPEFLTGGAPPLVDQLRAGFLGSYVFVLQSLVRRYFQNDLKANAYYAITERIIIVPIVIAALSVALPMADRVEIVTAFVVGIFPLVGLRAVNSLVSRRLKTTLPSLQSAYPLSDLDGMTIWYETRLLEEGIEDMQSLITANVVDLMLNTRIPVSRIVDWLDQAHLYIHLAPVEEPSSSRGARKRARSRGTSGGHEPSDRELLRRYGIRCATDLEDAFAGYVRTDTKLRSRVAKSDQDDYYGGLKNLIKVDRGPSITLTVLNCLQREPTLDYVRNWKAVASRSARPSDGTAGTEDLNVNGPRNSGAPPSAPPRDTMRPSAGVVLSDKPSPPTPAET
ncbi:MAG TPA: hypothetical protein VGR26_05045 [Acidimicrobiales bacterium]|nr:hypothetical protein [Acidimicrobiales bacterium]